MNIISRAELARRVGKSKQYISRRVDQGMIGMVGKGPAAKVNLDDGLTVQFIEMCRQNTELKTAKSAPVVAVPKQRGRPPKRPRKKKPSVPPVEIEEELPPLPLQVLEGLDVGALTVEEMRCFSKLDLDRLKMIEAIRAQRQKTAESRKELVVRESVQRVLSKLFMIHVNQLRTLDQNIMPDIAAIFENENAEKMNNAAKLMNKEIFKILGQIKRLFNDWLKAHEAEEIKDDSTAEA